MITCPTCGTTYQAPTGRTDLIYRDLLRITGIIARETPWQVRFCCMVCHFSSAFLVNVFHKRIPKWRLAHK